MELDRLWKNTQELREAISLKNVEREIEKRRRIGRKARKIRKLMEDKDYTNLQKILESGD